MSDNTSWITQFVGILGGGVVGFFSSLLLEPVKKRVCSPHLSVTFPIGKDTNLRESATTPYIVFISEAVDSTTHLEEKEFKIAIRCIVNNDSRFYTAENCRVLLTGIKTRDNQEQEWKPTNYKESNQVTWAEKQYEFEAVDIFPKTSMAFEPIILYTTIYKIQKIQVQIFHTHFSFDYLFQIPPPLEKGWRFSFLVAGQNFPPIPFDLTLECLWLEISGNPAILIQVNECLIEVYKLGSRNIADPKTYEAADQECLKQRKGPTKIDIPI
jgi:hypothetical protein